MRSIGTQALSLEAIARDGQRRGLAMQRPALLDGHLRPHLAMPGLDRGEQERGDHGAIFPMAGPTPRKIDPGRLLRHVGHLAVVSGLRMQNLSDSAGIREFACAHVSPPDRLTMRIGRMMQSRAAGSPISSLLEV